MSDIDKSSLDSKKLENIVIDWYNKVEKQSEMYTKHAKQLKFEELSLYENISTLENMNQYSERLIQDYGACLNTMQELSRQQKELTDVLDKVENEIDNALKSNNTAHSLEGLQRIRFMHEQRDITNIEKSNYRQQMDMKAEAVNYNLDEIEKSIQSISKAVSQKNTDVINFDQDDSDEVNRVMNQSYEALRWIEDTAYDLTYQIELLDRELKEM